MRCGIALILCLLVCAGCPEPKPLENNDDIVDQEDELCEIGAPTSLKLGEPSTSSFKEWANGAQIGVEAVPQGGVTTQLNLLATGVPRTAKTLVVKVIDGSDVLSSSTTSDATFPCVTGLGRMRALHTIGYQVDFLALEGRNVVLSAEAVFDDDSGGELKIQAQVEGTLKL